MACCVTAASTSSVRAAQTRRAGGTLCAVRSSTPAGHAASGCGQAQITLQATLRVVAPPSLTRPSPTTAGAAARLRLALPVRSAPGAQRRPSARRPTRLCQRFGALSSSLPARPAHVASLQAAATTPKIRIKLRSYESTQLREAAEQIVLVASNTGATVAGPIPLPTRRRVYCVLRSPHVNKNSMEHFQLLTHQRLIDVKNPSAQTIDALMQLDMPAGVDIEVKL